MKTMISDIAVVLVVFIFFSRFLRVSNDTVLWNNDGHFLRNLFPSLCMTLSGLLTCILKVTVSNVGWMGHRLSWVFLVLFVSYCKPMLGRYPKLDHDRFLPHHVRLIVYWIMSLNAIQPGALTALLNKSQKKKVLYLNLLRFWTLPVRIVKTTTFRYLHLFPSSVMEADTLLLNSPCQYT